MVDRAAVAASRSAVRSVASSSSRWSMRPADAFWMAAMKPAEAALPALDELRFDQSGDAPRRDAECCRRQLAGGHRGHSVDQIVRLVDDQQLVFGQYRRVGDGVDGQQRVVGDDDVGAAGLGPRPLGEAVGAERAAGHPEAFPRGHADLTPRPVGHAGFEVVAVAGLRGRRPLGEPLHLASQRGGRLRPEQLSAAPRRDRRPSRCESCSGTGSSAGPSATRSAACGAARRLSASTSWGRSRLTSWRCRAIVAVDTTTGALSDTARSMAGTRYASDFPVPVPA